MPSRCVLFMLEKRGTSGILRLDADARTTDQETPEGHSQESEVKGVR
jgi:hypothetical protein